MFLKILRWIFFLPLAAVLTAIAQTVTMVIAENLHWYFSISYLLVLGFVFFFTTYLPGRIAPNHKVGAVLILIVIPFLEITNLYLSISDSSISEYSQFGLIARLYTDIILILGGVAVYKNITSIKQLSFNQNKLNT